MPLCIPRTHIRGRAGATSEHRAPLNVHVARLGAQLVASSSPTSLLHQLGILDDDGLLQLSSLQAAFKDRPILTLISHLNRRTLPTCWTTASAASALAYPTHCTGNVNTRFSLILCILQHVLHASTLTACQQLARVKVAKRRNEPAPRQQRKRARKQACDKLLFLTHVTCCQEHPL